ncbi:DUF4358 domain-containing protein [Massilicoli timonensis]|uniref:DUF4358 domain-containing protein n=1 Tax=Massilicoli timonensis TaxID=2015901 RepID=UPI000C84EACA|nr:DUF4358 domain-containing protein [Massilicoli timonensis]
MKSIRYLIYLIIAAVLLIIPFLKDQTSIDMDDLAKALQEKHNSEYISEGDKSGLRKFYHINFDDVERFILYIPATSMRVNEVAIIQAKGEVQAESIFQAVNKRKEEQLHAFEGYGIEQCELLKQAILMRKGNYVIYVVGEDAKDLYQIIETEVHG